MLLTSMWIESGKGVRGINCRAYFYKDPIPDEILLTNVDSTLDLPLANKYHTRGSEGHFGIASLDVIARTPLTRRQLAYYLNRCRHKIGEGGILTNYRLGDGNSVCIRLKTGMRYQGSDFTFLRNALLELYDQRDVEKVDPLIGMSAFNQYQDRIKKHLFVL